MKTLVLLSVIAVALGAPLPEAEAEAGCVHASPVLAHHNLAFGVPGLAAAPALTYAAVDAVVPALTYAAGHAVAPALTYAAGHAVAPAVTYAAGHAVAPAVTYAAGHAVAPAVSYAASAPAVVAPAVAHTAVAYAAPTPVALPPAEVKVPITKTHVEVPIKQHVHYGTQAFVAGSTTTIHKPSLAASAIAPPSTLLAKVTHNAPEVTIKEQVIPVEKHVPNFVDTPYHAGTIVKYTEPEIKEVKVPTPYAKPVPVEHPVPVGVPQPVLQPVPVPHEVHSLTVHGAAPVGYAAPLGYHEYHAAVVKAEEH